MQFEGPLDTDEEVLIRGDFLEEEIADMRLVGASLEDGGRR